MTNMPSGKAVLWMMGTFVLTYAAVKAVGKVFPASQNLPFVGTAFQ